MAAMSRGKKAYQQYERELSASIAELSNLREQLKAGIDEDSASYKAVMLAYKESKTASNGEQLIEEALKKATQVPLSVAQKAYEVSELIAKLKPITSKNMWSDLAVASSLAHTAIEGALANVKINLESIQNESFKGQVRQQVGGLGQEFAWS